MSSMLFRWFIFGGVERHHIFKEACDIIGIFVGALL
jgi:hypothetical protein